MEGFRRELADKLPARRVRHVDVRHAGCCGTRRRRPARQPYYASDGADQKGYERLVISLDRGELRYADLRKLRGIWLAADDDETAEVMGKQGPDALGLDLPSFRRALQGRRGALKPALMDQSVVAGLGNLLTDEILWQARLPP